MKSYPTHMIFIQKFLTGESAKLESDILKHHWEIIKGGTQQSAIKIINNVLYVNNKQVLPEIHVMATSKQFNDNNNDNYTVGNNMKNMNNMSNTPIPKDS